MTVADAHTIATVADRLFAAIEAGDHAGIQQLWDDDVVVWKSGDTPGRDRDKASALRVLDWFIATTTRRRYEILDRQVFDGGFVQQHILHATGRDGAVIAMRVCIVIKVGPDGLINRIDEYFDPVEIAPLLESNNR